MSDRALDREVAEKVMGWKLKRFLAKNNTGRWYWKHLCGDGNEHIVVEDYPHGTWQDALGVPHYSSDLAAAFHVVERMREIASSVLLNWAEDNNLWEVSWITGGKRYSSWDKSLFRAICRAALAACEAKP